MCPSVGVAARLSRSSFWGGARAPPSNTWGEARALRQIWAAAPAPPSNGPVNPRAGSGPHYNPPLVVVPCDLESLPLPTLDLLNPHNPVISFIQIHTHAQSRAFRVHCTVYTHRVVSAHKWVFPTY